MSQRDRARKSDQDPADQEHAEGQLEGVTHADLVTDPPQKEHGQRDPRRDSGIDPGGLLVAQLNVLGAELAQDGENAEVGQALDDVRDVDPPEGLGRLDEGHHGLPELKKGVGHHLAEGFLDGSFCGHERPSRVAGTGPL